MGPQTQKITRHLDSKGIHRPRTRCARGRAVSSWTPYAPRQLLPKNGCMRVPTIGRRFGEFPPGLKRLIAATDADSITLTNGIQIQCVANSFRNIRGPTVVCAIFEELAFWFDERSANPDKEILRAVRPSMLTVPGALLLGISSPYGKRGLLYEKYRDHFGRDDSRVLVWKADTQTMNPIADAYEQDPAAASAEYGAEFRNDLEGFVSREALDAVTSGGVSERPPLEDVNYVGFVDPNGGSRDSFTAAIAHLENKKAVLDAVREQKSPFSPAAVVDEYASFFRSYGIRYIRGDRYSGAFVRELFQKAGLEYRPSNHSKSDIYLGVLPAINSGLVELLDNKHLLTQIAGLERRTARGGRDSVDHAPNGHDDLCNAALGALNCALGSERYTPDATGLPIFGGPLRYDLNEELKGIHHYAI